MTNTTHHPLDRCQCGGRFKHKTTHQRYTEDISLPDLTPDYKHRLVTKRLIERGVCDQCGQVATGQDYPLGGQKVTLGPNVRLAVCDLVNEGYSYSQVKRLLQSHYQLKVSSGQIAGILDKQANNWQAVYQALADKIRQSTCINIDETPWAIQALFKAGYAWLLANSFGPETYYCLAQSRGAPVARELLKDYTGVRITDNYAAYRNKESGQQIKTEEKTGYQQNTQKTKNCFHFKTPVYF